MCLITCNGKWRNSPKVTEFFLLRLIQETNENRETSFEERSRKFLAMWSFSTGCFLSDLTLRSAPSFGKKILCLKNRKLSVYKEI